MDFQRRITSFRLTQSRSHVSVSSPGHSCLLSGSLSHTDLNSSPAFYSGIASKTSVYRSKWCLHVSGPWLSLSLRWQPSQPTVQVDSEPYWYRLGEPKAIKIAEDVQWYWIGENNRPISRRRVDLHGDGSIWERNHIEPELQVAFNDDTVLTRWAYCDGLWYVYAAVCVGS